MNVLVINSGSSSIKFSMFAVAGAESGSPVLLYDGELGGIGTKAPEFKFKDADGKDLAGGRECKAETVEEAIRNVEEAVGAEGLPKVEAVGYRVVHPGPKLQGHQRITPEVLQALRDAEAFAPLHDPVAVEIIEEMMKRLPDVTHYACFDTVFHETMPEAAKTYAIPDEYREQGVRRYGFHGLSCESIVVQMREAGGVQLREAGIAVPRRMVIAHLGSGCSVTAVIDGRSVDTTMGLTPTGGVVMGTRPGDLDPGLLLYLLRTMEADTEKKHAKAKCGGLSTPLRSGRDDASLGRGDDDVPLGAIGLAGQQNSELEAMLNHKAGIVALSGMANDMRAVRKAASAGETKAKLAVEVFVRSVRKAIGGFAYLMGGVDAIVFTGGIGEHDARTRFEVLAGLEMLGIGLDDEANKASKKSLRLISAGDFKTAVYVVPAEEDRMIASHVGQMAL